MRARRRERIGLEVPGGRRRVETQEERFTSDLVTVGCARREHGRRQLAVETVTAASADAARRQASAAAAASLTQQAALPRVVT